MAIIKSKIDTTDKRFIANTESMRVLVEDLHEKIAFCSAGGSEKSRERHKARGKLLPRERIAQLVDDYNHFLEFSHLAAYDIYDNEIPSAGIITGIAKVHGQDVLIVANDATVDRKSTRLNSSHRCISYAVFCLKKKKQNIRSVSVVLR